MKFYSSLTNSFISWTIASLLAMPSAIAETAEQPGLLKTVPGSTNAERWNWLQSRLPTLIGLSRNKAALVLGATDDELNGNEFRLLIPSHDESPRLFFRVKLTEDSVSSVEIYTEPKTTRTLISE